MANPSAQLSGVPGELPNSSISAKSRMGRPPVLSADEMAILRQLGEQLPGASVAVIAARLRPLLSHPVSANSVARSLIRLGLRRRVVRAASP